MNKPVFTDEWRVTHRNNLQIEETKGDEMEVFQKCLQSAVTLEKRRLKEDPSSRSDAVRKYFEEREERNAPLTKKDGEKILEAIACLSKKIDLIFGDNILIRGKYVSIADLIGKKER